MIDGYCPCFLGSLFFVGFRSLHLLDFTSQIRGSSEAAPCLPLRPPTYDSSVSGQCQDNGCVQGCSPCLRSGARGSLSASAGQIEPLKAPGKLRPLDWGAWEGGEGKFPYHLPSSPAAPSGRVSLVSSSAVYTAVSSIAFSLSVPLCGTQVAPLQPFSVPQMRSSLLCPPAWPGALLGVSLRMANQSKCRVSDLCVEQLQRATEPGRTEADGRLPQ